MIPAKIANCFDYLAGDTFAKSLIDAKIIESQEDIQFNRFSDARGRVPDSYIVWNWTEIDAQQSMRGTALTGVEIVVGLYVKDADTLLKSEEKAAIFRENVFVLFEVLRDSGLFHIEITSSIYKQDVQSHGCLLRLRCR